MIIDIIYDMSMGHIGPLEIDLWQSFSSKKWHTEAMEIYYFLILFWQKNLTVTPQNYRTSQAAVPGDRPHLMIRMQAISGKIFGYWDFSDEAFKSYE